MDGTRPDALSDAQLDRELEAALAVEPSPEFLARVRTRVATEPQPSMWRPAGWRSAVEPMWAVAIAGIVLAVVVPRVMRDEGRPLPPVAANVLNVPHASGAGFSAAGPERQPIRTNPVTQSAGADAEWGRTVPLQLSPALFAEEDQRVFALFVAAAGDGRVPDEAVQQADESAEMEELSIKPLVIAPLPSLARAVREGEDQWQ